MKIGKMMILAAACLAVTIMAGCGDNKNDEAANVPAKDAANATPVIDTTPVTLKLFLAFNVNDAMLKKITDPVKQKYPHITIEPVKGKIEDLVATGDIPDIIYSYNSAINKYTNFDIVGDITYLITKHKVDLGRFDPNAIETIRRASNNQLYGLPYSLDFNLTFYNKDLFDKFGVPYLTDGMTWDEVLALVPRLAREDGGVRYLGLDANSLERLYSPFAGTNTNAATNKASVDNQTFRTVFELGKKIYEIPNNLAPGKNPFPGISFFYKDRNIAIQVGYNIIELLVDAQVKSGLNWDMVQYPSYKEIPNVTGYVDTNILAVTKTSKNRDQAMLALRPFLTSIDAQKSLTGAGQKSPLKDPQVNKNFGADIPELKGKNLSVVSKGTQVPAAAFSQYESEAYALTRASFLEYYKGKDLNTALREATEKIDKKIAELQFK